VLVPGEGREAMWRYGPAFRALPEAQKAHFPRTKEGGYPNEWRMVRCAQAARLFTGAELIAGLELLLEAHVRLVSTQLDPRLVLEETVFRLARRSTPSAGSGGSGRG
jgi:DNA polymerase III subunit delta